MKPPVYFDLDLMYPWIPGIFNGFESAIDAEAYSVQMVAYRMQPLINIDELIYHHWKDKPVAGLVTAEAGRAEACYRRGIPCVQTNCDPTLLPGSHLAAVSTDHPLMGRIAAEKLIDCGYRRLGILVSSSKSLSGVQRKAAGFRDCLHKQLPDVVEVDLPEIELEKGWITDASIQHLASHIMELEPPVGLAAGNVQLAWGLWKALFEAGSRIPEDFGIISIGDDPVLLTQTTPAITGIRENSLEIGRLCAESIRAQIRGEAFQTGILVPPIGVVERESTAVNLQGDPVVRRALAHMETHLDEPGNLDKLARTIHTSRATLLRRFKEHLGCSPSEELRRMRLRRALGLIQKTDHSFAEISVICGYGLQSALSRAVREATGHSPSQLRRQTPQFFS